MIVELDHKGQETLSALLMDVLKQAQSIQDESDARRATSDETRTWEVAILGFEMAGSIEGTAEGAPRPKRSRRLP